MLRLYRRSFITPRSDYHPTMKHSCTIQFKLSPGTQFYLYRTQQCFPIFPHLFFTSATVLTRCVVLLGHGGGADEDGARSSRILGRSRDSCCIGRPSLVLLPSSHWRLSCKEIQLKQSSRTHRIKSYSFLENFLRESYCNFGLRAQHTRVIQSRLLSFSRDL